jgi:hypothetical protein
MEKSAKASGLPNPKDVGRFPVDRVRQRPWALCAKPDDGFRCRRTRGRLCVGYGVGEWNNAPLRSRRNRPDRDPATSVSRGLVRLSQGDAPVGEEVHLVAIDLPGTWSDVTPAPLCRTSR